MKNFNAKMPNFILRLARWGCIATVLGCFPPSLAAQTPSSAKEADAFFIKRIHDAALAQPAAFGWLQYLTRRIGGRLSGSPQAAAAVEYTV